MMPALVAGKTDANHSKLSYNLKDELSSPVRQNNNQ